MKLVVLVLVCFVLAWILTPILANYFEIELNDPGKNHYRSDELSFLETYYLMKKGEGYYSAFKEARESFAYQATMTSDTFTWREPLPFYLWKFFAPNGLQILTLFLFLSLLSLIGLFLIFAPTLGSWALLSPIFVLPYIYDTLSTKTGILFSEWWGLFFFIFGLVGLIYQKKLLLFFGFLLAMLCRELFVVPVVIITIASFRKESIKLYLIILLSWFLLYNFHAMQVSHYVTTGNSSSVWSRFHGFRWGNLQEMISFSMRRYVFLGLKTHYLFFGLALLSLSSLYLLTKSRLQYLSSVLIGVVVLFPLISVLGNDYWGIMFMPLSLAAIPALGRFITRK